MLCMYCDLPMRDVNSDGPTTSRAEWLSLFEIAEGWRKSRKMIKYVRKTKEHIIRKCDGGSDDESNIGYAHMFCNSFRGDATPKAHRKRMLRMVREKTHPLYKLKNKEDKNHVES